MNSSENHIAEVMDRLAQLQLSGAQWQILAAIYGSQLRQGNGEWQNQPCLMSFGGLKGATDVSLRHVTREVKDLLGRNILVRIPSGQNYLFRFNLDYSTWVMSKTKPTPQVPSTASELPPLVEAELSPQPLEPAPEPQAERIHLEAEFARRIQGEPDLVTFLSRESGRRSSDVRDDDDCLVGEENKNYISGMVMRTLSEEMKAFDDYLRYGTDEEHSKGQTTRHTYCWTVELFHRFLDGRKPTPEVGKEFIKDLEERGNSPSSINRHIWALKSYFRFRIDSGIPDAQEFKIRGLKTQEHKPRFLRDKEWDKLLSTATKLIYDPELLSYARQRAKLELALLYAYCGAGLRCSEAVNLKMEDFLDDGFIRVTRKGGREDFVPVEDEILRGIKDYIESRAQDGRYIFSGKVPDTPMAARTAQGIIKSLCRRAGLPDVHVHSLRHTAGYQLRKAGAQERDIQDFLGHKNIATTKLYTHLVSEDLRRKLPRRFAHARQGRLEFPSST